MGLMINNKIKNGISKKKLNYEERVIIERYLKDGISKVEIAKRLWRDYSNIKRKIKRNGCYDWNNLPRKIHWYKTPEEIFYLKKVGFLVEKFIIFLLNQPHTFYN